MTIEQARDALRRVAAYFGDGPLIVENGIITRPEAEARQQDGSALRTALERAMAAVESLPILPTQKHNRSISEAHHALTAALAALPPSAPPALDVNLIRETVHAMKWCKDGSTMHAFAHGDDPEDDDLRVRFAAEYARLTGAGHD